MSVTFDVSKGSANFAPSGSIYNNQHQQDEPVHISGASRNWPRVFLLTSSISMGLVMASSILNLITLNIGPPTIFLEAYVLILCFFALSAELRQINCLRGIIYHWIKYLYFLTTYTGRSLFYIFLGTLILGNSILRYVAAAAAIVLGIVMFIVNIFVKLPEYVDPQMVAEQERERRAVMSGMNETLFGPSPSGAQNFSNAVVNPSSSNDNYSKAPPTVPYRPPGINEGPNAL